jgi:hypothetical protein
LTGRQDWGKNDGQRYGISAFILRGWVGVILGRLRMRFDGAVGHGGR